MKVWKFIIKSLTRNLSSEVIYMSIYCISLFEDHKFKSPRIYTYLVYNSNVIIAETLMIQVNIPYQNVKL